MRFNEISDYSGNISTQNIGSPNGNAVTAGSTVTAKSSQYAIASIQVSGTYVSRIITYLIKTHFAYSPLQ